MDNVPVGPVQGDLEKLSRIVHLAAIQRLEADLGVRDEPSPPRGVRPAARPPDCRDAHAGGFYATDDGAP